MHLRTWMLAGLMALPVMGWADESPAPGIRPSFDIHGDALRKVIKDTAASQSGSYENPDEKSTAGKTQATSAVVWRPPEPAAVAGAPRSLDHFDCDAHQCVARDQQHAPLYKVPAMACQWHDDSMMGQQPTLSCDDDGRSGKSFFEDLRDDVVEDVVGGLVSGLFNSLFSKP